MVLYCFETAGLASFFELLLRKGCVMKANACFCLVICCWLILFDVVVMFVGIWCLLVYFYVACWEEAGILKLLLLPFCSLPFPMDGSCYYIMISDCTF